MRSPARTLNVCCDKEVHLPAHLVLTQSRKGVGRLRRVTLVLGRNRYER